MLADIKNQILYTKNLPVNNGLHCLHSSKFEKRFGYKTIGAKVAVKEIVHQLEKDH